MPTTCGFPNCKFRSRYRGVEDNRHFYRIPKRPHMLRKRWLIAIGRTEETVVSQLRICSAHFEGGEKKEGDIPVADPAIDPPISIDLPPKEGKASERKRAAKSSPPVPKSLVPRKCFVPDFLRQHQGVVSQLESGTSSFPIIQETSNIHDLIAMSARSNAQSGRPLVALLDGRDCSVEMPLLKDVATVAFCDAQSTVEIHEKVLNEAVAALMWHSIRLEKADLEKFKALRVVVRIGGDCDNIDLQAATELGIAVCTTPGGCVEETADTTMSMILSLYRNTHSLSRGISADRKPVSIENMRAICAGTRRMRGEVLGLVGFGRVGMAVALRAKAFGFHVIIYDPHLPEGVEKALGVDRCATLMDLVTKTNCLSLHCPLNEETRHMISEPILRALPTGSFIVNTARGGLINEMDLSLALRNGHVRAAALDVFEYEPHDAYPPNHLALLPNVLATPHACWFSEPSSREQRELAAREVRRAITGRIPHDLPNCVNKEELISSGNTRRPVPVGMNQGSSGFNPLHNMPGFPGRSMAGFNGIPGMNFPMMNNPMLAAMTGGIGLNPLLMNPNSAAQALALAQASVASGHTSPAAALSSLAAASLGMPHSAGSASSSGPNSLRPPSAKSPRMSPATFSPYNKAQTSPAVSNGTANSNESSASPSIAESKTAEPETTQSLIDSILNGANGTSGGTIKDETRSNTSSPLSKIISACVKEDMDGAKTSSNPESTTINGNGHALSESAATA